MDKFENIAKETNYWLIRPGIENLCFNLFKKDKVVAIGWDRIGMVNGSNNQDTVDHIKQMVSQQYQDLLQGKVEREYRRKISDIAYKIFRFYFELKKGDIIVCPGVDSVLIGKIIGNAYIDDTGRYSSEENKENDEYIGSLNKVRNVEWIKEIRKDKLEPNILLELRVVHGLSQINKEQVITEINRAIFDLYSYNDEMHSIFRIKNEEAIDFYKYAFFINCLAEGASLFDDKEHSLIYKSNINSPGPVEIIGGKRAVTEISKFVSLVLLKKEVPSDYPYKDKVLELQNKTDYSYDDYGFPCGGKV